MNPVSADSAVKSASSVVAGDSAPTASIPRLLVLTDRTQCSGDLVDVVAAAVGYGARAVVLREKDLPPADRAALAAALRGLLDPVGGRLILAGTTVPADALHLAAADPAVVPRPAVVGRSCHDAAEVTRAALEGCDYVTVSPIYPTESKPGYGPALGPAALTVLCGLGPAGYALGGVRPEHVAACIAAGARGVAVMGAVMRNPAVVADYLAELLPAPEAP